jgi:hypothetical protein
MENTWLENTPIETEAPITFAELEAAKREAFQEGVNFALLMMRDDTDFEPEGITFYCSGCRRSEFLTDAEAEKKGWTADRCGECAKPERIEDAPYFQKTLVPQRKPERVGRIRI